jgi:hypothetical protein
MLAYLGLSPRRFISHNARAVAGSVRGAMRSFDSFLPARFRVWRARVRMGIIGSRFGKARGRPAPLAIPCRRQRYGDG